jgi:hypothetical protein
MKKRVRVRVRAIKSDDSDDETNHPTTMKRRLSGNEYFRFGWS